MTLESRYAVTEALEAAGWTSTTQRLTYHQLTHPSGAAWEITTEAGGCALYLPDGQAVTLSSKITNEVVIAACLAATGQLDQTQTEPTTTDHTAVETETRAVLLSLLLDEATTAMETNAVTRCALRAGLLWRCHPCKRNHHIHEHTCTCGAHRPTAQAA